MTKQVHDSDKKETRLSDKRGLRLYTLGAYTIRCKKVDTAPDQSLHITCLRK